MLVAGRVCKNKLRNQTNTHQQGGKVVTFLMDITDSDTGKAYKKGQTVPQTEVSPGALQSLIACGRVTVSEVQAQPIKAK